MLGFLAGLPGQIATLTSRLTSGRATNLDNLDAAISTRAAASTALSNATWTSALAAALLNVASNNPLLKPPKASGVSARQFTDAAWPGLDLSAYRLMFGSLPESVYDLSSTAAWTDIVNYSGSGVLELCAWTATSSGGGTATVEIIADGVTVMAYTSASLTSYSEHGVAVGDLFISSDRTRSFGNVGAMPFYTTLQIRAKLSIVAARISVATRYRKVT